MRIRVFKDPIKYAELLSFLAGNFPYLAIARHFHCDHTSIIYQARKIGIKPERHALAQAPARKPFIDHTHIIVKSELINDGTSYAEYKRAERERNTRRFILAEGLIL